MALVSLLLATTLIAAEPVKLTHTYVKDTKSAYALELKLEGADGRISGDVTFTALDSSGSHSMSCPSMKMAMFGSEQSIDASLDKLTLDSKGLAKSLTFDERGIAVIIPTIFGFLPDAAVEVGKSFDIKEKRDDYSLSGSGKLLEVIEKDGVKTAVIEYKMSVEPASEAEPGTFAFTSTFDVATGQLISSKGKVDVGANKTEVTLKKK